MRTTTQATSSPLAVPAAGSVVGARKDGGGLLRIGLHLLLAALPLLAISAHVFGLVRMQLSAALLVVPLATAVIALTIFAPHAGDRVLAHGFLWGMIGTAIYDVFRLDTVYMLHWWADFIPTMGTWITGDDGNKVTGAIVGYLWRYPGDGGGIGITFFALASAVGLHQRSRATVVWASIAFAVFPVWAGLIGTVALASQGQTLMFPLTPTTITLSLIGHLIFGAIMGLGFWRSRSVQEHWPWAPLTGAQPAAFLPGTSSRFAGSVAAPSMAAPSVGAAARTVSAHPAALHPAHPEPARPAAGVSATRSAPGPASLSQPIVAPPPPAPEPALPSTPASVPFGLPALPLPRDRGTPPGGVARPAATSWPDTGATRVATPPSGQSLDPHTWELWQRQMTTTVRGRRTHRARR